MENHDQVTVNRSILMRLANAAARRAYEQTQVVGPNSTAEHLCAIAVGYLSAAREAQR
jgi:hypothetical protein